MEEIELRRYFRTIKGDLVFIKDMARKEIVVESGFGVYENLLKGDFVELVYKSEGELFLVKDKLKQNDGFLIEISLDGMLHLVNKEDISVFYLGNKRRDYFKRYDKDFRLLDEKTSKKK